MRWFFKSSRLSVNAIKCSTQLGLKIDNCRAETTTQAMGILARLGCLGST